MSAAFNPALHKTILLGVARAPLPADAIRTHDDLDAGRDRLSGLLAQHPQEQMLWHAIAAADLLNRAGYQAPVIASAQAAEENARTCPPAAEHILNLLLRGVHPELLPAWMQLAAAQGFSVPPAQLPALLESGLQQPALRKAVLPLLDKRGHWLIAQNPVWAKCYGTAGDNTQAQWNLGNLAERTQALRAMREADPDRARAALQAGWDAEPAENRAALLACLAVNASPSDESFLERALDDKRKEVRSAAQQRLAALPDSQLVQRCIARLAPLLTMQKKFIGGAQLTVTLPEACDKAMLRDGIGAQTHHGLGEKAGWLLDMMQRVPPAHWASTWDATPQEVITLMAGQEFQQALLQGLTHAAIQALQHGRNDTTIAWYSTLLQAIVSGDAGIAAPHNLMQTFGLLPASAQQQIVQGWLGDSFGAWHSQNPIVDWCRQAAENANAPWPAALSGAVIARVQAGMQAGAEHNWRLQGALNSFAGVLDITDTSCMETGWPNPDWAHWPTWRKPIDTLSETLRFRHTMHRSFLETSA